MRSELEDLAEELRMNGVNFEDSTFEVFLRKYAIETMLCEKIQVTGKETGYMHYLMKQKAGDMVAVSKLLYLQGLSNGRIDEFATDSEIKEIARREHSYGHSSRRKLHIIRDKT